MPTLIDSSLWIDFTRARSPKPLKQFIAEHILFPEASLAEPIVFEVLRHATDTEIRAIETQFQTMPMLSTPENLWTTATTLGQTCRRKGVIASSLDLLIVTIALHHNAELITFDRDFQPIAKLCGLKLKLLHRP